MMDLQAYDSIMTPSADGPWVLKSDVNKYISDLTEEIERLKEYEALYKGAVLIFEDEQKYHKATRKALWLARAERAKCAYAWHKQTAETLLRGGTSCAVDYQNWKAKRWVKVERLCRAKAYEDT